MKRHSWNRLAAVAAATLLVALAGLVAGAAGAAGEGRTAAEHMQVDGPDTCTACHAEVTPAVHDEWFAGKHGVNNVRCYVCHGSTGDDFRTAPSAATCASCHPGQAASLADRVKPAAPMRAGGGCFACHPPHLLSPHVSQPSAGAAEERSEEDMP